MTIVTVTIVAIVMMTWYAKNHASTMRAGTSISQNRKGKG